MAANEDHDEEMLCKQASIEGRSDNGNELVGFDDPYETRNLPCPHPGCTKILKKRAHFKNHILTHTGEKPYKCNECGKAFSRPYHLTRHSAIHKEDVIGIKCPVENCEYSCKFKSNLNRHIKRHHGDNQEKPFQCEFQECEMKFKRRKERQEHQEDHEGDKPFKCEYEGCNKRYMYIQGVQRHFKSHGKQKGYLCPNANCNAMFQVWTDLQKHKYACTVHKCDSCGRIFKQAWQLKNHEVIHRGDRTMYHCPVEHCDREYTTESNVVSHVRACHQNQNTFKCPEENCGQTFAHKCSLKRHMDNHDRIVQRYNRMAKNRKKKEKKRRKQTRLHASDVSKVTGVVTELENFISESDINMSHELENAETRVNHSSTEEEDNFALNKDGMDHPIETAPSKMKASEKMYDFAGQENSDDDDDDDYSSLPKHVEYRSEEETASEARSFVACKA